MWAKWVLSFGAAAILLVALIIYVDHHNTDSPPSQNLAAQSRANREAELVVARDQAPHVIRLASGLSAQAGMTRTVRAAMSGLIDKGIVEGPLQHVRCTPHRAGGRLGLSCVATANDVNYDFVGVADPPARRLTYCKRDEPPVPSMNIPVSARCQA
ncbi:MAG TPA: hypothetical protein VGH67_23060 [Solirubrobacteraceae bacterium]|jgi:hypothetical protein